MKRILVGLLWVALIGCAISSAQSASPDRIGVFTNATIVLREKPCDIGLVLASAPPEVKRTLKGGTITYNASDAHGRRGITERVCWLEHDGYVYTMYENLNVDALPSETYKAKPLPKGAVSI